ncbi:radical SAM family heme chaperone HemW [Niabella terrae]
MSGIYIHIPFCRQACHYCNFHFATSLTKKEAMVSAIGRELEMRGSNTTYQTVYFGGGTPSLLSAADLAYLLDRVRHSGIVLADAEITLEANPDDLQEGQLINWKAVGINRLSIGVQSFFQADLEWMNRAHNEHQAREGLELALKYFDNISIDLIYGSPGLSDAAWQENLETAIAYGIPHLSCYALTVEPRTPLDKLIRTHRKADIDPEQQSRQFLLLMQLLRTAGYEHYEISNFAQPGCRSRHNSAYWEGSSYLGIGPSAHSYTGRERSWNIANNQQYIDAIARGQLPRETEMLTPVQQINESIMIGLRRIEGLDISGFTEAQQRTVWSLAKKYEDRGQLRRQGQRILLSDEGKLFADGIAADLFFEEDAD